jgi:hypothetical protein
MKLENTGMSFLFNRQGIMRKIFYIVTIGILLLNLIACSKGNKYDDNQKKFKPADMALKFRNEYEKANTQEERQVIIKEFFENLEKNSHPESNGSSNQYSEFNNAEDNQNNTKGEKTAESTNVDGNRYGIKKEWEDFKGSPRTSLNNKVGFLKKFLSLYVYFRRAQMGEKYSDVKDVVNKFIDAQDKFAATCKNLSSADDAVAALNDFTTVVEAIAPKMKEMSEKYPELKNKENPPEELKPLFDKIEAAGKKMSEAMTKMQPYQQDPRIQETMMKLFAAMAKMAPQK